jgi:acetyl esterase/lipase
VKTRLLAELGALMVFGQARAALRRLARGPARPDWTWRIEMLASGMRAIMMRSKRRGVHWLRAALEAAPVPTPFRSRVRCEDVDAGGVRARWFVPQAVPASSRTIVYFHGGGFVIGSPTTHGELMARLAVASGTRVLGVDYRLAPEHRFPAAHDDAVAAVLFCPWVDLLASGGSMETNAYLDFGDRELLSGWAQDYVPGAARDPRVFPIDARLDRLPPLLIQVGGAELLHDQVVAFADRARAAGVDVTLEVEPAMFHDWQLQAALLPEGERSIESAAQFLTKRLA